MDWTTNSKPKVTVGNIKTYGRKVTNNSATQSGSSSLFSQQKLATSSADRMDSDDENPFGVNVTRTTSRIVLGDISGNISSVTEEDIRLIKRRGGVAASMNDEKIRYDKMTLLPIKNQYSM